MVVVHDPNGNPLPGMKVTAYESIRKSGTLVAHVELAATAITGRDGKVAVGLGQDDYTIGADVNGISSQVVQIQVYDDGTGASEINLTWPGGSITDVQSVSGVLGVGKGKDPLPGLELSLKNAASGSIAKTVTDSVGHFAFQRIPQGFYGLHVSDPNGREGYLSKLEGDIPIHVSADATNRELPRWGLMMSSCGFGAFTDEHSIINFGP